MKKDKVMAVLFLYVLLGGMFLMGIMPRETFSESERRPLASFPAFKASSIRNGVFFEGLDRYWTDHFPFRDSLRSVKAVYQRRVILRKENDGLTDFEGSWIHPETRMDLSSVSYAASRVNYVISRMITGTDCRLYYSVIPDKSYFLKEKGWPVMDHKELAAQFGKQLPEAAYISLFETLSLPDYYKTDSHWRQEKLIPAANTLLEGMGNPGDLSAEQFEEKQLASFLGVYAGQSALSPDAEPLVVLEGPKTEQLKVYDLEKRKEIPLYDLENCDPRDLYTLFAGGNSALVQIVNPEAESEKELVVFRDSFAAPVAPLLSGAYRTVTFVDLRYIHPDALRNRIRFEKQDVLFLYSSSLLNSSRGLK